MADGKLSVRQNKSVAVGTVSKLDKFDQMLRE